MGSHGSESGHRPRSQGSSGASSSCASDLVFADLANKSRVVVAQSPQPSNVSGTAATQAASPSRPQQSPYLGAQTAALPVPGSIACLASEQKQPFPIATLKTWTFDEYLGHFTTVPRYQTNAITLGEGSEGKVVLVRNRSSQEHAAFKEFKVDPGREVAALKFFYQYQHPNILSASALVGKQDRVFGVVLPFCQSLHVAFQTAQCMLEESHVQMCVAGLLRGLSHMHQHSFLHRDIKMENLLLREPWQLLIGDFGSARLMAKKHARSTVDHGTPPMAPMSSVVQTTHAEEALTTRLCTWPYRAPEVCFEMLPYDEALRHNLSYE